MEEAILARVDAISNLAEVSDPAYAKGLRSAVSAAIGHGLVTLEKGRPPPREVPEAILVQARLAARSGARIDVVLRRYFGGYVLFCDFLLAEADVAQIAGPALGPPAGSSGELRRSALGGQRRMNSKAPRALLLERSQMRRRSLDKLRNIDDIEGTNGADILYGDSHENNLLGRPGKDQLWSRGGNDNIEAKDGEVDEGGGSTTTDICTLDGIDKFNSCNP
jgi:hypothetical protein